MAKKSKARKASKPKGKEKERVKGEVRREATTVTEKVLQKFMGDDFALAASGLVGFGADALLGTIPEVGGIISAGAHAAHLWQPRSNPAHPANRLGSAWQCGKAGARFNPGARCTMARQRGTLLRHGDGGAVPFASEATRMQPFHVQEDRTLPSGRIAHFVTGRQFIDRCPVVTAEGELLQSISLDGSIAPLAGTRLAELMDLYGEVKWIAATLVYQSLCAADAGGSIIFAGFRDPDRTLAAIPDGTRRVTEAYTLDGALSACQLWKGMAFPCPFNAAEIYSQFGVHEQTRSDQRFTSAGRVEALSETGWDFTGSTGSPPGCWFLEYDFVGFDSVPTEASVSPSSFTMMSCNLPNSVPLFYAGTGTAASVTTSDLVLPASTVLPQARPDLVFDGTVFDPLCCGYPILARNSDFTPDEWTRAGSLQSLGVKKYDTGSDSYWGFTWPRGEWDFWVLVDAGWGGTDGRFIDPTAWAFDAFGGHSIVYDPPLLAIFNPDVTTSGQFQAIHVRFTSDGDEEGYLRFSCTHEGTGAGNVLGRFFMALGSARVASFESKFDPLVSRYLRAADTPELSRMVAIPDNPPVRPKPKPRPLEPPNLKGGESGGVGEMNVTVYDPDALRRAALVAPSGLCPICGKHPAVPGVCWYPPK